MTLFEIDHHNPGGKVQISELPNIVIEAGADPIVSVVWRIIDTEETIVIVLVQDRVVVVH
jgi:hypothetical protein